MSRARLLTRVIVSHLAVAVPPAVVLGVLVVQINREALRQEVQELNLAVAEQLAGELSARTAAVSRALGQADRLLDMDELPLDRRKILVAAIVADGQIPYLGLYGADGAKDSWFGPAATASRAPARLDEALMRRAKDGGTALGEPTLDGDRASAPVVVPWVVGGETWGFLVSELDLSALSAQCARLAELHLGEGGELLVADGGRRVLAASARARVGEVLGADSPLGALQGDWASTLGELTLRSSSAYRTADGASRLASVVSDGSRSWLVASSRPEAVAFASLARVRARVVALALAAALAAGLAGLLLARAVSEPVRRLTEGVHRAWSGGFTAAIEAPAGPGEIAELTAAFNGALDELRRHRDEARLHANIKVRLARFLSPTAIHQILSADPTRPGATTERVTVLYADLAGASELVRGQLETGHLVQVLGDFFACATAAVEGHGGRLDRFSGDVVIAVFRAAEGREGRGAADAAVAAAQKILLDTASLSARWAPLVGLEIAAAVGLSTGDAPVDTSPTAEVTVAGDLVDRAARQQQAARPGVLLVDAETRRALASTPVGVVRPATTMADCFEIDLRSTSGSVTTERVHP